MLCLVREGGGYFLGLEGSWSMAPTRKARGAEAGAGSGRCAPCGVLGVSFIFEMKIGGL